MSDTSDHLRAIDEMLEAGEYEAARQALDEATSSPACEVPRIQPHPYDATVAPPPAHPT